MSRRPSSPTSTSYSGISTYRSNSYKPHRDMAGSSRDMTPADPQKDPGGVARSHYDELRQFLASHLAKEPLNSRSSAREKLTRLTKQQFQELSTDVYDELIRRNTNSDQNEVPFLPVRDDFHPKRNQARQKLATLPKTRFKDLSSDVFYELGRRYPQFKEPEVPPETPVSEYSEKPSEPDSQNGATRRPSQDSNSQYGDRRKPSQDLIRNLPNDRRILSQESVDSYSQSTTRRPSGDTYGSGGSTRRPSEDQYGNPMRRPSEDTVKTYQRRPSDDIRSNGLYRQPSQDTSSTHGGHSTATSGVIIPNKSTIAEEKIEVPYGKDDDESSRLDSASDGDQRNPKSQRTMSQGFGALGANLMNTPLSPTTDEEGMMTSQDNRGRGTSDYYDKMSFGRASVASSVGGAGAMGGAAGREAREEAEKMRSEYEYKIATMQKRMNALEADLVEANDKAGTGDERVQMLSRELESMRARTDDQASVIRGLQRELEGAQAAYQNEARQRAEEGQRRDENEAEFRRLQQRIEELERERFGRGNVDRHEADDMRAEIQTLVDELKELASRNDELTADKEADQAMIDNLTNQMKDYKRKYEQAKTELRNVKATSQLFLQQAPKAEDQLPVSESGAILDIHVTAFQSATDGLLMAARSSAPSSVFGPMRNIVTAVSTITDDVRAFEQRQPKDRMGIDDETLQALRERADATLSNLVTATKNHAMGNGLSPVSLVDAAASHVSASIVAIIKTVMMRKSTAAEREREQHLIAMAAGSPPPTMSSKGFSPGLRSIGEVRDSDRHGRTNSETSQGSNGRAAGGWQIVNESSPPTRNRTGRASGESALARRTLSDRSSNPSPQPPLIFDAPSAAGNTRGTSEEGSDDAWEELKPYLDVQSESIVLPIRNLLSSIRGGATAPELNENLTQIITIVSSIVAVCKDSLPTASGPQGEEIIQLLSDNCNKLSELQSQPEITKQTRQSMASSSFAIAKAMKELRAL